MIMSSVEARQPPDLEKSDALYQDDPRWSLAIRVSESPHFRTSRHLSQFLLFLCEHALKTPTEELSEQIIGEKVFLRRQGYSTGEDNIVRSYAHRLRNRLEQYFQQQGVDEPIRICVPKGAYIALFEENVPPSEQDHERAQPIEHKSVPSRFSLPTPTDVSEADSSAVGKDGKSKLMLSRWQLVVMVFCLLLTGTYLGRWSRSIGGYLLPSPAHVLWEQLFTGNAETLIVTTDNGLGVLQDITGKYANLNSYINGNYFAQFANPQDSEQRTIYRLSRERLTSVADSTTAAAILSLPEAYGHRIDLRNARNLQLEDLKQTNLIMLGSNYGNPWLTLFEPTMNFVIDYHANRDTYESEIINKHPLPGESRVLINNSTSPPYTTYALVALRQNLNHDGWVLMIGGLTTAGTEAAGEFILHGNIQPLLHDALRQGHLRPFEVILKLTNLDSEASPPTILMKRIS